MCRLERFAVLLMRGRDFMKRRKAARGPNTAFPVRLVFGSGVCEQYLETICVVLMIMRVVVGYELRVAGTRQWV